MSENILENVWPEWRTEGGPIGVGSYGRVYKAVRTDYGVTSYSAVKVISIPNSDSVLDSLRAEGLSEEMTKKALSELVDDFANEIRIMSSLKSSQNVVGVEDYKVVKKEKEIGWDIYIRMELLTPLTKYVSDRTLSEEETVRLGTDILSALELLRSRNIIHRDIKPQNIFVNDLGDFKLGDFGIAKQFDVLTGSHTVRGTLNYMAPEVRRTGRYGAGADLYSLGLVLYTCLNNRRLPFLDPAKQLLSPFERDDALRRRMRGEALPAPCGASEALSRVILRACAFDPAERYSTPSEMKKALLGAIDKGRNEPTVRVKNAAPLRENAQRAERPEADIRDLAGPAGRQKKTADADINSKRKKRIVLAVIASALILCALTAIGASLILSQGQVRFRDPVFEEAFRKEYGLTGKITKKDLLKFTSLKLRGKGISNIEDAAMFKNLVTLDLGAAPDEYGSDTPLRNRVSDLTPLAGLTKLQKLNLSDNEVSDISPLAGLSELTTLGLANNRVSDLSPLSGLEKLEEIYMPGNLVADPRPLFGLGSLRKLTLTGNPIPASGSDALRKALPNCVVYVD